MQSGKMEHYMSQPGKSCLLEINTHTHTHKTKPKQGSVGKTKKSRPLISSFSAKTESDLIRNLTLL